MSLLVVDDLHKTFRNKREVVFVLAGVNLEIEAGEMVAVTGVSGAGKSTLLHIIGGLEAPDKGTVTLNGSRVSPFVGSRMADLRNESIGFVFQHHHLLPDLTAEENAALPLLVRRMSHRAALRQARLLLDAIGLSDRAGQPANLLSGGEQQRVAIARALAGSPALVLADEPTGSLDQTTSDIVGQLLLQLCRERRTAALVATHNPRLAALCDRILKLENGYLKQIENALR